MLLVIVVIGCLQLTMMMHKRMSAAQSAQEEAEAALKTAQETRNLHTYALATKQLDSAPHRAYLDRWLPTLEETNEETKARAFVTRVLKQNGEGLATFSSRSKVEPQKDSAFIPNKFTSTLSVEGDYALVAGLVGAIERQLPASRLSMVGISKGQRSNDVKLNLTVEIPMIINKEKEAGKTPDSSADKQGAKKPS
jgi:hypothetical protein